MPDPRKNSEGYSDPTAYEGMKPIIVLTRVWK